MRSHENVTPISWNIFCTCENKEGHEQSCLVWEVKAGAVRLIDGIEGLLMLTAEISKRHTENPMDWK